MAASSCADWLLHRSDSRCWQSAVLSSPRFDGAIELTNGLVSRVFLTAPSFALLSLERSASGRGLVGEPAERFSRGGLGAEGRVLIDGRNYTLGGLTLPAGASQYLNSTALREAAPSPDSFTYLRHRQLSPRLPFDWVPGRHHSDHLAQWPPAGTALQVGLFC